MTNVNPLIHLRNQALIWSGVGVVMCVSGWWIYGFFGSSSSPTIQKVEDLQYAINLLEKEGVITTKKWAELTPDEKKDERWNTINKLVPTVKKLIGAGTPAAAKNIITIKNIGNKVGDGSYVSWLEKSWTGDAETALTKTQSDLAEVIPVFTGISELESTKDIGGKITLKSLNDYIQINIVDKFGLSNAFGQIGIDRVKFLADAPEVGVYDIPLHFDRVPNENVINLLGFLGKTGGVNIKENGKTVTIEHLNPQPIKIDNGQSSLKNLLITVKDMSITPTKTETQETKSANISTKTKSMWDVSITLQFYIRGVSRDYIASLDSKITTLLNKSGKDSLITQANILLKQANGGTLTPQIRDIIALLGQAKAAYDSILLEERDPKKNFSPLEILSHRTELMTTIETLQKKLMTIGQIISPPSA